MKLIEIKNELDTFYFEALRGRYLEKRKWKTVFLPFRNSYDFDCELERSIKETYSSQIECCQYEVSEKNGLVFHDVLKIDLKKKDLYDIKSSNELKSFVISNRDMDFFIIYGPFDYTCISGSDGFLKKFIEKEMVEDYISEVQSYSSIDSRKRNMEMIKIYCESGYMLYAD